MRAMMSSSENYQVGLANQLLLVCALVTVLSWATLGVASSTAPDVAGDQLVTIVQYVGWAQQYRRLWQKKLFVTPGEVARFVHLPAFVDTEVAMSVYQAKGKRGSLAGDYWVTVTEPTVPLSNGIRSVNVQHPVDARTITIHRADAPLPESAGQAVRRLWSTMLGQVAQENSNLIARSE